MSMRRLLYAVWRGRFLILLSTVVGGGAAYLYFQTLRPTYTSTARLLVERPHHSQLEGLRGRSLSSNYLAMQAALLTSRTIVERVMRDPNVLAISGPHHDNRLSDVIRTLTATVDKRDDIITVAATSEDPNLAAAVVDAVVRAYARWVRAMDELDSSFDRQLQTNMEKLQRKRQDLMALEQRNPALLEHAQAGTTSKTLDALQKELAAARIHVIELELCCARLRELESDPNGFRDYVMSQDPSIDSAEQVRPGEVVEFDRETARRRIALAETRFQDAKAREQELAKLCQDEVARLQDISAQTAEHELLRNECQMLEDLCDAMLKHINSQGPRVWSPRVCVLERAKPGISSSPRMAGILLIGLALGLTVGIGLSIAWEWACPTGNDDVTSGRINARSAAQPFETTTSDPAAQ